MTAASKRRRFGPVYTKTTSFYLLQRQNDVVSPTLLPQIEVSVRRPSLPTGGGGGGVWGGGGGGEDRATSPAAARLDRRAHMISELAAAAGDWGFGPTSERWAGGHWTANDDGDLC